MKCIRPLALTTFSLLLPLLFGSCAGRRNVDEKMMWSTYPLATLKGAATGFVINHRDASAPGGVVPVVLTSAHVLDTLGKGPLIIAFRKRDAAGEAEVALLVFAPVQTPGGERFYVRHPTQDLAAFALHLPAEIAGRTDLSSCLEERMLARNGKVLHTGMEVSFLGYPEPMPETEGAFALLRSGRVASHPLGTAQAKGRFIINSDVYPGDSGAPVFIARGGGRPELVGVISQRVGPDARAFSHFAIAVDADVVRETMKLLDASEKKPVPVVQTTARKTQP